MRLPSPLDRYTGIISIPGPHCDFRGSTISSGPVTWIFPILTSRRGGHPSTEAIMDLALMYEFNFLPYKTAERKTKYTLYIAGGPGYHIVLSSHTSTGLNPDNHFTIPFSLGFQIQCGKAPECRVLSGRRGKPITTGLTELKISAQKTSIIWWVTKTGITLQGSLSPIRYLNTGKIVRHTIRVELWQQLKI